jgi:hypothetical protein
LTGKFDLTNVNNMAFYISGPKLLFETTEISTHPNSTQQESNYIYLYTTKFGTSIKIRLNRKFESTEFETMRVNCTKVMPIMCQRKVWRYQWGNQKPYIVEGQTTQWPKDRRQKNKQRSTKHYTENKRSSKTNLTKNRGWTQVLQKDK